jgi:hypothetical protein
VEGSVNGHVGHALRDISEDYQDLNAATVIDHNDLNPVYIQFLQDLPTVSG